MKKKLTRERVVGRTGKYTVPIRGSHTAFKVDVTILDAVERFNRLDMKITPVAGQGEAWVSDATVEINAKK